MDMRRRTAAVGVAALLAPALLAAGCASTPEPHPVATTAPSATPAATPADDPPRWLARREAGTDSPQQLSARTAALIRAMNEVPAGPAAPADATPAAIPPVARRGTAPSSVHFDDPAGPPPGTPTQARATLPPTAPQPPTPAPTPDDPRVNVLSSAVDRNALAGPREVPESADFAPTAAATPPDPLGERLAKRAKASPSDLSAQLDAQLYGLLDGKAAAPSSLPGYAGLPPEQRDALAAVIDGVNNYRSAVRTDPTLSPTQQVRPWADLVDRLRAEADLSVSAVTLCSKVKGFGQYVPIVPAQFTAGKTSQMIVYFQVDNFQPQQTPAGLWELKLSHRLTLLAADGGRQWPVVSRTPADQCHDRRRDYFAFEVISLPPTLPLGRYTVKVDVTDAVANKHAEADVSLVIAQ